ncbi:aliphatic sulfonate ABC transporter substrate-binding protein [Leptolyngbya sp. FACHB-671]|uniref:aliphatic sulfonate ABC transporter substrate-binding protein n=1 Tax=Leptolyngbya sp. FACHB-671 TaxID=2692812 RepID=UPI0016854179|nr:aliphatic sulfonate ABC transporter substrate-binding protein [Leptolyngbya sp. FACHB-671]MBD2071959.1 aliphatic sulfonate ABC transporter substrate-binding protein [Leptolyngbya sp. FACHB-671]
MIANSRRTLIPRWVRGFRALNPRQVPGFAFLFSLVFSLILVTSSCSAPAGDNPGTIKLDFAYYNPVSLVLKEKGWLEEELAQDNVSVEWVQSLGSNKALELLNSRSIDFGSTAGAAALLGKANGNPIKSVYIYSRPEWTALVTTADSDINTVEDLQGRKVAVTRGTDPHIFLLRALDQVGLSEQDIEVVQLQHADGKTALERGDVDAWAGLDPHMAQTELEKGSRLFFRDPDLNTYGFLNVREAFAQQYPDYVERVLAVYERARQWSLENPNELKAILQKEAKLSDAVATKQLERTDLSNAVIGQVHKDTIVAAGDVLKSSGVIPGSIDVNQVADELVDPQFVEKVASHQRVISHQKVVHHPQHSHS